MLLRSGALALTCTRLAREVNVTQSLKTFPWVKVRGLRVDRIGDKRTFLMENTTYRVGRPILIPPRPVTVTNEYARSRAGFVSVFECRRCGLRSQRAFSDGSQSETRCLDGFAVIKKEIRTREWRWKMSNR